MVLGTTYIFANDIKKSVDFYSKLLQEKPLKANDDRWVQFSNIIDPDGNTLEITGKYE